MGMYAGMTKGLVMSRQQEAQDLQNEEATLRNQGLRQNMDIVTKKQGQSDQADYLHELAAGNEALFDPPENIVQVYPRFTADFKKKYKAIQPNQDGSLTLIGHDDSSKIVTKDGAAARARQLREQAYAMTQGSRAKIETPQDLEFKQAKIDYEEAKTQALENKPLTADQIAKESREQREEVRLLKKNLSDAKKAYFDQQAIATAAIGKKEEVAERARALEMKRVAESAQQDLDDLEKETATTSKKQALRQPESDGDHVRMVFPDGKTKLVPSSQIDTFLKLGGKRQ